MKFIKEYWPFILLAIFNVAWITARVHADVLRLAPNTTVKLTPGVVYDSVTGLGAYYAAPPGCNISGRTDQTQAYPIIRLPSSSEGYAFKFIHSGPKLTGVRIEGGGIYFEAPNNISDGLVIDDVEALANITGPGIKRNVFEINCYLKNFRITRNQISSNSGFAMLWPNTGGENGKIANNVVISAPGGIHFDGSGHDVVIEQNYGATLDGQFIEAQGSHKNLIVQDNDYTLPTKTPNGSKYAYSIPNADGDGTIVRRNRATMPTNVQQWPTTLIVFELGGKNLLCEDNYSNGGNDVIAINGAFATGIVRNNRILNYDHMTGNNNGATCTLPNNGPNVSLSWDINRAKPQRFVRYGGGTLPQNVPDPTPSPVPLPVNLYFYFRAYYDAASKTIKIESVPTPTLPGTL